jgi:hypothetical protein
METEITIPLKLRRRISYVEEDLDNIIKRVPDYGYATHKELFINSASRSLSLSMVVQHHREITGDEVYDKSDYYAPFIESFFRDKLSLHWEKQNGK